MHKQQTIKLQFAENVFTRIQRYQFLLAEDREWKMETEDGTEQLVIHWMDGQLAPQAILDLLACNCKGKCSLPKCVCIASGLKCTDPLPDCKIQKTKSVCGV